MKDNFSEYIKEMIETHEAKAHDYGGMEEHPQMNYLFAGEVCGDPYLYQLARIGEKLIRLKNIRLLGREMSREGIKQDHIDIANISLLALDTINASLKVIDESEKAVSVDKELFDGKVFNQPQGNTCTSHRR